MQDFAVKNIFSLLGLMGAPLEAKQMLTGRMVELVEKRVMIRVLDFLRPEEQEELLRLFDAGSEEDRSLFLQKHVPHIQKIIEDEVMKLKYEAHQYGAQSVGATA